MDGLDDQDIGNIKFLLSLSVEELNAWWDTLSPSESQYATTLLEMVHLRAIDVIVDRTEPIDAGILVEYIRQKIKVDKA